MGSVSTDACRQEGRGSRGAAPHVAQHVTMRLDSASVGWPPSLKVSTLIEPSTFATSTPAAPGRACPPWQRARPWPRQHSRRRALPTARSRRRLIELDCRSRRIISDVGAFPATIQCVAAEAPCGPRGPLRTLRSLRAGRSRRAHWSSAPDAAREVPRGDRAVADVAAGQRAIAHVRAAHGRVHDIAARHPQRGVRTPLSEMNTATSPSRMRSSACFGWPGRTHSPLST